MDSTRIDEILQFWFGEIDADGNVTEDRSALWWKKRPETDAMIRDRFEPDVGLARSGQRDHWAESPRGRLALIVCLDQLTRNIYRDSPEAFASDEQARSLCLDGLQRRHDRELPLIQRVFFYMPLEHAEDRELQRQSVVLFTRLTEQCPPQLRQTFETYLDFARRHHAIVERFGRFPHRNAVLGRSTTAAEQEFLKQPGSSF